MQYVFTLALGPVQEFLVAARRTRDLWFGSWLLSELARAAGEAIARECGSDGLIFPAPAALGKEDATFTNKILAVVDREPREVGALITEAVEARLGRLRAEAFKDLSGRQPLFLEDRALRQIADLIEIQWASAVLADLGGYKDARDRAEALLAARKNTRLWKPVDWGDDVPKSSVDGQRESVLHESLFDDASDWTESKLSQVFGVGEKERLCGVGLLKRRGRRPSSKVEHHFLSTGHLAAWPLLYRLGEMAADPTTKAALGHSWAEYLQAISAAGADPKEQTVHAASHGHSILGRLDGSLLFEGRLPDLFVDEKDKRTRRQRARPLQRQLAAFLELAGVAAPCPYFTVLVADGDFMGAAIEAIAAVKRHQDLSSALSSFAERCRQIVEADHHGELVFAGGDDVLAFVPLHRAVGCAQALACEFAAALRGYPTAEGRAPTLSVGIGISHFMEPLSRALALARAAEREAKRERNSLAVFLDKRSGPPLEVAGHWDELAPTLTDLVELHCEDRIPDGMAYELRHLARLAAGAEGEDLSRLEGLVRKEAERILRRKQPRHGEAERISKEDLERLTGIYDRLGKKLGSGGLTGFADRLILARILAEAQTQAAVPAPAGPGKEAR